MERLVVFGAVLAFVSLSHTSAQQSVGSVVVDDGRVGIGLITGGNFGPKSFSIISSPGGRPKAQVNVNEDERDVQHMVLQTSTNHKGQQDIYQPPQSVSKETNNSEGFNIDNTQLYPVKSLTNSNPGQESNGSKKGNGAGQILVGAVVLNSNKQIKDDLDAAAIAAIFGSNGKNTGLPSAEKGSSNTGTHGNIQIDVITGDHFENGTLNINNNRKPEHNVLQKGSGLNNENTRSTNTENDAQDFKNHNTKSNIAVNTGEDSNHGQTNSGYNSYSNDERWIWNR